MLPDMEDGLVRNYAVTKQPSRTYRMDLNEERIAGYTDQLEAVRQMVYCILNTERYENLIYSWNYGMELKDLYGKPIPYIKSELKRRIKEALIQDDRILDVNSFDFKHRGGTLTVRFMVETDCGVFQEEKEMEMYV